MKESLGGSSELKNWALLTFLSIIWGTSFILIKKSLLAFTPVEVAILRVSISGIAFFPFFVSFIRKLEWSRWWLYLIIALTGSAIPAILYAKAQTQISSAMSGIINSMTPVFALIIGILFFQNKTSKIQLLGSVIGFTGVTLLIALDNWDISTGKQTVLYSALVLIGTMLYGTNVNLVKEYFQHVKPMHLSAFAFVLAGIPTIFFLPFTEIPSKILHHPQSIVSTLSVTVLALVSTVFAIVLFYKLVQETNAVFGSSVAYLIPVVALIWGIFDGESIGLAHIFSLVIILIGVYLIRRGSDN